MRDGDWGLGLGVRSSSAQSERLDILTPFQPHPLQPKALFSSATRHASPNYYKSLLPTLPYHHFIFQTQRAYPAFTSHPQSPSACSLPDPDMVEFMNDKEHELG